MMVRSVLVLLTIIVTVSSMINSVVGTDERSVYDEVQTDIYS